VTWVGSSNSTAPTNTPAMMVSAPAIRTPER
jgi:hypothetical protein